MLVVTVVAPAMLGAPASSQTPAPRTVLTIHQNAEDFPGTESRDAAIRDGLAQADVRVNYFAEYLESEEFPAETAATALRDYIRRKFEDRHIDIVIADASAALQFALRYREELFPDAPIVFIAVTVPQAVVDRTASGITGVLNDTPIGETLELALRLHPSAKRVFVVTRARSVAGYDERIRSALSRFSARAELTYLDEPTLPALLAAVKAVPPGNVILYTRYVPDENVHIVYPDEIARLIAGASPVPVYAATDLYLGSGVVGGMVRTPQAGGARVGQIARRILDGTPPENIPITAISTTPMFDWRQVTRWGIDPSRLPPESRMLFRMPTAWDEYRPYIVGTFVVVAAQLLLIAGLVTQRSRRLRAERTIGAREASLRTSYDRIRQLAGQLIHAQEAVRASIAQDLHDDVCQQLAAVSVTVDHLKTSSGRLEDVAAQRAFADLSHDTRSTLDGVRRLAHELHPATLRVLGLAPALKTHCTEFAKRHGVEVAFRAEGDFRHLHPDVAVCLFRIGQESLRNGLVHGDARWFAISLTRAGDDVEMTVSDNGRGFDLDAARRQGHGLGLVSMEERARLVDGDIHIITGPRLGTTIRVTAPARTVTAGAPRDSDLHIESQ